MRKITGMEDGKEKGKRMGVSESKGEQREVIVKEK